MTPLRRAAAALMLSAMTAQAQPAATAVPPGILACDRAAAAPHDATRPEGVPGVPFALLDPADAPACEQARRDAPDIPRLSFQLARLRERAGQEAEAMALYGAAARLGHVAAALRLARMEGPGVAADMAEAARMLRQAGEGGSDQALIGLAELLAHGAPGLPPDEAEALRLLRRAARGGTPEATFALGLLRMGDHQPPFGRGAAYIVEQIEGAHLIRAAAERGHAPAQSRLALLHQHGLAVNGQVIVTEDEAEALRLYRLAAEGGDLFALNSIGVFHEQGRGGLAKDDAEALRHYRLGAARGYDTSMFNMGRFALEGRGGQPQDREAGIAWHRRAARAGNLGAELALRRLGLDW